MLSTDYPDYPEIKERKLQQYPHAHQSAIVQFVLILSYLRLSVAAYLLLHNLRKLRITFPSGTRYAHVSSGERQTLKLIKLATFMTSR